MSNIKLTYFTPTYNRAHLLPQLYKSLIEQNDKNFIWMIIDDGSTDNTESLINSWKNENVISIQYIKKDNGGKHTAIDLSNQLCETEFICCIDSDDYITPDCTSVLYSYMSKIENDSSIVGIVGRRDLVGFNKHKEANWPQKDSLIYFPNLESDYHFTYDTILVFKTHIIKNFTFPTFNDERFVTEIVYYNKFIFDYKMIVMDEFVYIGEYQEDGYTNQGMRLFIKNPKGWACFLKQKVWIQLKQKKSFKTILKSTMVFYGWHKIFKINDVIMPEYKIPFIYRLIGKLTVPYSKKRLLKKYKNDFDQFYNKK